MEPLRHGYTNNTRGDGTAVVKRYLGPDASARAERERAVLLALPGRVPVPPVLGFEDESLTMGFMGGTHGQELLEAGQGRGVLHACGAMLRQIHHAGLARAHPALGDALPGGTSAVPGRADAFSAGPTPFPARPAPFPFRATLSPAGPAPSPAASATARSSSTATTVPRTSCWTRQPCRSQPSWTGNGRIRGNRWKTWPGASGSSGCTTLAT